MTQKMTGTTRLSTDSNLCNINNICEQLYRIDFAVNTNIVFWVATNCDFRFYALYKYRPRPTYILTWTDSDIC